MNNGKSLINLGDWDKVATVLIEKISEAFGGCLKPWQIRRVARAEAEADRIKAIAQIETQIEVTDISRRALGRFLIEETNKQNNMESIISKALPQLKDDSRPQEINNDWITIFLISAGLFQMKRCRSFGRKFLLGRQMLPEDIRSELLIS